VTPQWRAGPSGPKTLCNACGVKHKKGLPLAYLEARLRAEAAAAEAAAAAQAAAAAAAQAASMSVDATAAGAAGGADSLQQASPPT